MTRPIFYDPRLPAELRPPDAAPLPDDDRPFPAGDDPVLLLDATDEPAAPEKIMTGLERLFRIFARVRAAAEPATLVLAIREAGFVGDAEPYGSAFAVAADSLVRSMAMECGRKQIRVHAVLLDADPQPETWHELVRYLAGPAAGQSGGRFWLDPAASLGRMVP